MVDTPAPHLPIPPLENGDHLARYEFERRYNAMPHLKKAELIEGIVYMPAALRFRSHGQPHGQVRGWHLAKPHFSRALARWFSYGTRQN
jgi:hypothetical protein